MTINTSSSWLGAWLLVFGGLPLAARDEPGGEHDHGHHAHGGGAGCSHDEGEADSPHHPAIDFADDPSALHFHPYLNVVAAVGGSDSHKNALLVGGAHAPIDDGFNLQAVEFGALLEIGPGLALRANANAWWDRYDGWDLELEEAFGQFSLPSGWRVRGGQMLVPFGYENTRHPHDQDFVEQPIAVVRMLGEEGLYCRGAEIVTRLAGDWSLSLGVGHGRDHSHGGSDREARREAWFEAGEHAAESHSAEDDDHDDQQHPSHGLAGLGGVYDPDDGYIDGLMGHARLVGRLDPRGRWQAGASTAIGRNGADLDSWIVGGDLLRSFELAERPAWWRSEAYLGHYEARNPNGTAGHYQLSGIYSALGWNLAEDWTAAGRVEWSSGNRMAGLERRWRFSAILGRRFVLAGNTDAHLRLQYSCDRLGGYGDAHSVWLQCVINLGAAHHGHQH